eukprot:TRINITY_DN259_c1_g3_i1.p1 TRINITY_DN259_c1_g3~~TRINITY_DN259_c1_g3_i1.p1  ORF type:complete len:274 (-),score=70.92 TRINITY_DN259_c1_g3_i1:63-803(-)
MSDDVDIDELLREAEEVLSNPAVPPPSSSSQPELTVSSSSSSSCASFSSSGYKQHSTPLITSGISIQRHGHGTGWLQDVVESPKSDGMDSILESEIESILKECSTPEKKKRPPLSLPSAGNATVPVGYSMKQDAEPARTRRCPQVVLVGSDSSLETACDNIRCTKCDLEVIRFPGHAWNKKAKYLFFRTNYPDARKLSSLLDVRPSSTAYCCQCSWISVTGRTVIDYRQKVKWVCGGHPSMSIDFT